jgi:hypothetical protein
MSNLDINEIAGLKPTEYKVHGGSEKVSAALAKYDEALKAASPAIEAEAGPLKAAHEALSKVGDFNEGKWTALEGKADEFAKAQTKFAEETTKFKDAIGKGDALKDVHAAKKELGQFDKFLGGKLRASGFTSTVKDNLGFWDKGAREGRGLKMAGRYVGLAGAAYLGAKGLSGEKSNGEERSGMERFLLLGAALGVAGLAAVGGRAR